MNEFADDDGNDTDTDTEAGNPGFCPRGGAHGWITAKLAKRKAYDPHAGREVEIAPQLPLHLMYMDSPVDASLVDYVAFKLTDEARRETIGLVMSVIVHIDQVGLWFYDGDGHPEENLFWAQVIPWGQVIGFGMRPHT